MFLLLFCANFSFIFDVNSYDKILKFSVVFQNEFVSNNLTQHDRKDFILLVRDDGIGPMNRFKF